MSLAKNSTLDPAMRCTGDMQESEGGKGGGGGGGGL